VEKYLESAKPQMRVWRRRIACRMSKARKTHLEYSIFIAFHLQQWLHERVHYYFISILPVLLRISVEGLCFLIKGTFVALVL